MNLEQTKLVGLTMKLELKTRQYRELCNKLEKIKNKSINPNEKELLELKEIFEQNHNEITDINKQIKRLKDNIDTLESEKREQYNVDNLFKNNNKQKSEAEKINIVPTTKKSIFQRIFEKLKKIIKK